MRGSVGIPVCLGTAAQLLWHVGARPALSTAGTLAGQGVQHHKLQMLWRKPLTSSLSAVLWAALWAADAVALVCSCPPVVLNDGATTHQALTHGAKYVERWAVTHLCLSLWDGFSLAFAVYCSAAASVAVAHSRAGQASHMRTLCQLNGAIFVESWEVARLCLSLWDGFPLLLRCTAALPLSRCCTQQRRPSLLRGRGFSHHSLEC